MFMQRSVYFTGMENTEPHQSTELVKNVGTYLVALVSYSGH